MLRQLKVGVLSGIWIPLVQFKERHKLTVVVFVGDVVEVGVAIKGNVMFSR